MMPTNRVVTFEATPNPQTMKFLVYQKLVSEPHEYRSAQDTLKSPLAAKLFGFPWMAGIFLGNDFLTVTKQDWVEWDVLAEPLADLIAEHLENNEPILLEEISDVAEEYVDSPDDSEDVQSIKRILHHEIRPAVAMDGGDVVFEKFEQGIVYLHMRGACSGCPSSAMTLKMGIETRLKEAVPAIIEVVAMEAM